VKPTAFVKIALPGGPDPRFWRGRRVLLTGHTGFKGSWLAWWLLRMGAQVHGLALAPTTDPALFTLLNLESQLAGHHIRNMADRSAVADAVSACNPEVVLHLAAQALVRPGYDDPLGTFATNVMGTATLLEALRQAPALKVAVVVTTDKVYRNREWAYPYRETDELGGHDPYSASKAASELVVDCWRASWLAQQGVAVASARAGNVIGGGDWSRDRLLPDAVRAWQSGQALQVRRPSATRPWQHVLEPLSGYLRLAEVLWAQPQRAGAYNFGPATHDAATVRTVIEQAQQAWGGDEVHWGEGTEGPHEAGWLALEVAKARNVLGVQPRWSLQQAVHRTLRWYKGLSEGVSAQSLCAADLQAFLEDAS
jgi:CDP-glucose 4,6-dehydratase